MGKGKKEEADEAIKTLYFEPQSQQRCAVHTINNLVCILTVSILGIN